MKFGKKAAHSGAKRSLVLVVSVLVLLLAVAGGTLAWLTAQTDGVVNTFTPAQVSCVVTENFNGTTKSNVNVTNTSDIPAYIRVKLVTYRVNEAGQHIGGTASLPTFTLGANWVSYDGYYYYTLPVAPGERPKTNLTDSMTLVGSYPDTDGGKQVIEVMAEAIQSVPTTTVTSVWPVTVDANGALAPKSGN